MKRNFIKSLCLVIAFLLASSVVLSACDQNDTPEETTEVEVESTQPSSNEDTVEKEEQNESSATEGESSEEESSDDTCAEAPSFDETDELATEESENEDTSSDEANSDDDTTEEITTENTTSELVTTEETTEEETTEEVTTLPENEDELFVYELLSNGTYGIKKLKDDSRTHLTIPSEFKGKPVTEIMSDAIRNKGALTSVIIPASIVNIGSYAFMYSKLTSVIFAEGSSLERIFHGAFAFTDLTEIHLPDGLKTIDIDAFSNCYKLATVTLPESVNRLSSYAFRSTAIETETVDDITYWKNWVIDASYGIKSPVVIREGTVGIADDVFTHNSNLTSITLPESLLYIGAKAFQYTGLTEIIIPDSVTHIWDSAFEGCKELRSFTLSHSGNLTEIGSCAFQSNAYVVSLTIPASVKKIGAYAFASCKALSEVIILSPDISLGNGAFNYNKVLKKVVFAGDEPSISPRAA